MIYISGTKDFKLTNTAVALGKFDGLHRGHQVLINQINHYKSKGMLSVVFTFDYHPNSLFGDKEQNLIYTYEERRMIAERLGVDVLIEYPFTKETAAMEPADFVKNVLVDELGARFVVVGEDFRFGRKRMGDTVLLESMSPLLGYKADICRKICDTIPADTDGNSEAQTREIGATLIRKMLAAGDIETANKFLGRPFMIYGEVIHGRRIGRTIGMPTANIVTPSIKLLPPNGVYVSKTKVYNKVYPSVTNIGFNDDLYGRDIEVMLYHYQRPEMKFDTIEALKNQMHQDGESAVEYFKGREDVQF